MKLTNKQLRQIIKEELENVLQEEKGKYFVYGSSFETDNSGVIGAYKVNLKTGDKKVDMFDSKVFRNGVNKNEARELDAKLAAGDPVLYADIVAHFKLGISAREYLQEKPRQSRT